MITGLVTSFMREIIANLKSGINLDAFYQFYLKYEKFNISNKIHIKTDKKMIVPK